MDAVTIPLAVYELLMQREQMYELALKKKGEMRYEFEASALDMERVTLVCRLEMDALQIASQSKPCQLSLGTAAESFLNTSVNGAALEGLRQKIRLLSNERDQIIVNRQSSELMLTHCRKLTQLESAVKAMVGVMSDCREKLEDAIESRNDALREKERVVADLRKEIDAGRMEISEWAESRRKWLIEETRLIEAVGQLRGKLALVELQAAESLHVAVTQLEREQQGVVRLEGTISNLREEVKSVLGDLEHEKLQARDEAKQRSDLQTTVGELECEKAAWKKALAASKSQNDALQSNLAKVTYELEHQLRTLTTQVQEGKLANEMLQKKGDNAHEQMRGLKDDLRRALETIEWGKDAAAAATGSGGELRELRERASYLRTQLDAAELKVKAQRDEIDDLIRAHRNQVEDLENNLRRVRAQVASAQEQLLKVPDLQSKVDAFNDQVLQLTQESKKLVTEVGLLQAENARLTIMSQQPPLMEQHSNTAINVHSWEVLQFQYRSENDRLRLEVEHKSRELEAQAANMNILESRKEFLTKSLCELENHVERLSDQVNRERSVGGRQSTEQTIAEMRRLVPHWRWESIERSDRTIGVSSPSRLDMSTYSFNSSFGGNTSQR